MKTRRSLLLAVVVALVAPLHLAEAKRLPPTTVILVRHTEKEKVKGDDPPLSAEGLSRAERLATVLKRSGVSAILTSQYTRSRDTAAPVERMLGITADHIALSFSPAIPPGPPLMTAASRRQVLDWVAAHKGRTVMIVGHSNTIPDLIHALGGPEVTVDETVYSDLFVLTLGSEPSLVHLSYP